MQIMMKRILLALALVLTSTVAVNAAGISYPSKVTGKWCLINQDEGGWRHFKRGSNCDDTTLVLQSNGNYVLSANEYEQRCKADPKSYFKGWTDYVCINHEEGRRSTRKYTNKFLVNVDTGETHAQQR